MRIEIARNFLDESTCAELNAWVSLGVENKWLDNGYSRGKFNYPLRKTSRMFSDRYEYPDVVREVSKKIRAFCGVSAYPLIEGNGRDGVVVSFTLPGGDVHPHTDPPHPTNGFSTLRCNVMTQAADAGCVLHVGGKPVDIGVGDLHCYLVSEFEHFATPVEGDTPRIMWMFGAHVPAEAWENGQIKFGEQ